MDADSILDGLALWDEHKPQTGRDWIAIARRSVAETNYDPSVGSALFQGLYATVKALEEIERATAIEDSGDVDPHHQYQQVKRVQEIVAAALALPRQEVPKEDS